MQKTSFYLRLRILTLLIACLICAGNATAQVGIKISCADGWWAQCCRCANCLQVDPPPAYGYCRDCHLLCAKCRKDMGDLQAALEKLKAKNRALKDAYDAFEKQFSGNQETFVKGYEDLYGKEGDYTLSGLNSNLGKFASSYAAVMSNASGTTNLYKALSTSLQLYQSSSPGDAGINAAGGLLDVANSEWGMQRLVEFLADAAADKLVSQLSNGIPLDKAMADFMKNANCFPDTPWKLKDVSNAGEWAGLALDIYGYAYSIQDVWDNLGDISESAINMDIATEQMSKISDSIVKNVDLMICIRETQDSLKSGNLGLINNNNPFIAASRRFNYTAESTRFGSLPWDSIMQMNRESLKTALAQTKQLLDLVTTIKKQMEKEIIAPLIPWLTKKHTRLKKNIAILLLQKARKAVQAMPAQLERVKTLSQSIEDLLKNAVTGYEVNYMKESTSFDNVGRINIPAEKWTMVPNPKIKAGMGRMPFNYPQGIEWRVEFYKGTDYLYSHSSSGSTRFYDLQPGTYDINLNSVLVKNVTIGNGIETIMKYGVLIIMNNEHWELYSADRKTYFTSGNKAVKRAMVPGVYVLNIYGKDYNIAITDKVTVRFEVPNPYLKYE
jgi:hypothetical protein